MIKITFLFLITFILFFSACASSTQANKKIVKSTSNLPSNFEQHFLTEVNRIRANSRICGNKKFPAAPPLELNAKLTSASHKHSLDMSNNQFLEHVSSNGDTLVERMRDVHYTWSAVGENLAYNQKTIHQVLEDWLSSPGHCSNLMSADYTQAGVAVVNGYWTQVYAAPK